MALGNKLKEILRKRNITVKDFALSIGVPPTTLYSFIKRDSTTGNLELITKICKGLNIEIFDFLATSEFTNETKLTKYDLSGFNTAEQVALTLLKASQEKSTLIENVDTGEVTVLNNPNTIVIDTDVDTSHPFYILQEKVKSGEKLTEEERVQYDAYMRHALDSLSNAMERLGKSLKIYYSLLNDLGREKADEQMNHAVEQIEMLTKIPEYQRKEENED